MHCQPQRELAPIHVPLMGRAKKELENMERLGVTLHVKEPSELCARMVVVSKANV